MITIKCLDCHSIVDQVQQHRKVCIARITNSPDGETYKLIVHSKLEKSLGNWCNIHLCSKSDCKLAHRG